MSNDYDARAEARLLLEMPVGTFTERSDKHAAVYAALVRAFTAGARSTPGTAVGGDEAKLVRSIGRAVEHVCPAEGDTAGEYFDRMGRAALAVVRSWPAPATAPRSTKTSTRGKAS